MTIVEADALLDAFLAAKKAGQEELWRETHPEAPDGATVLIVWLMATGTNILCDLVHFRLALAAVDNRCAQRMAIYAAIVACQIWDNYCGKVNAKLRAAPLAAIRAAIACYRDPTANNRRAADVAAYAANAAANAAGDLLPVAHHAAYAAAYAAAAARTASAANDAADNIAYGTINAVRGAIEALDKSAIVVDAAIAAIADHYEGRPQEMP